MTLDALVIGAGPAGMAAALALRGNGIGRLLVVEREPAPGGILMQCIHPGFGLHRFHEELTGPEYAERQIRMVEEAGIEVWTGTCCLDIIDRGEFREAVLLAEDRGLVRVQAKAVILAMGCREQNRGNINIPGSRPAGIMTAGLAQKLVNLHGCLPGREAVILGSGDIGLIMARRLTLEGSRVKAVVELQPHPGGLNRNLVQCLHDFAIPLYLSHTVSRIIGKERIEAVEISPIDEHREPQRERSFTLACDTLLLSVGLIPENELSLRAGVRLHPVTRGAEVDSRLMTNVPGIFSCGNVLHVHDLADWASEEADTCGANAARFIRGEAPSTPAIPVHAGAMVRYVLPFRVESGAPAQLSLRAMAPADQQVLIVETDRGEPLHRQRIAKVLPSIMVRVDLANVPAGAKSLNVRFDGVAP
jgi:NADPH-dependent 2,4-dienoyl-CoA reductase/sulfur reductase-like enzyme